MRHRLYTLTGFLLIAVSCAWAQISEQRLFTIPYGTGRDQLAVPPLREEEESELNRLNQAPLIMRRLQTGDFAIVSYRRGEGVVVQVFNEAGQLRSYAPLPTVGADSTLVVYKGNIYAFSRIISRDLDREELIRAFRTDGKAVPLDEMRGRLVAVLREIGFDRFSSPIASCGDSLYIPVDCRSGPKLITLNKSGDIEISDLPLFGYPVCLPGCDLGVLEFDSPEENTGITLRQRDGKVVVRFSLKKDEQGLPFPHERWLSRVGKNNSLIMFNLVIYEDNTALGFPANTNIMTILDSKGQLVKRVQFDKPVGTHTVWDTDCEGNVYYLAFTMGGAEVRKLTLR